MPKKILLIDDDPFLVRFCKARLEQLGFKAICVENGDLVQDITRYELPDVIVLDVMLPGKNGFEVLEELKSVPETKEIPVVMLTQLAQESDKQRLRALGCHTYMVKMDHQLGELITVIQNIASGQLKVEENLEKINSLD